MTKFPLARGMLLESGVVAESDIVEVGPASRDHLEKVHSPAYLDRLAKGELSPKEAMVLGLPPSPELFVRSARESRAPGSASRAALEDGVAAIWRVAPTTRLPTGGRGFAR